MMVRGPTCGMARAWRLPISGMKGADMPAMTKPITVALLLSLALTPSVSAYAVPPEVGLSAPQEASETLAPTGGVCQQTLPGTLSSALAIGPAAGCTAA